MKGKLVSVIRTNVGITSATKYSEMRIRRFMMEEGFKRGFGVKYRSGQSIYGINNSDEIMIPKFERKMTLS